jgi:hypothetical protein
MIHRFLADSIVVLHFLFIVFVVLGGGLVLRWPRLALLHLPAAGWGAVVELSGWICPLTPLENHLRQAAGEVGYPGSFIDHYLLPIIYPAGLTRDIQYGLAAVVIGVNLAVYGYVVRRRRWQRATGKLATQAGDPFRKTTGTGARIPSE